jgi:hypothetical protein
MREIFLTSSFLKNDSAPWSRLYNTQAKAGATPSLKGVETGRRDVLKRILGKLEWLNVTEVKKTEMGRTSQSS